MIAEKYNDNVKNAIAIAYNPKDVNPDVCNITNPFFLLNPWCTWLNIEKVNNKLAIAITISCHTISIKNYNKLINLSNHSE